MATVIINSADTNSYAPALAEAARALRAGALVVFPTETVYGVAANAADPDAMRRLRAVKQSTERRPFTVHLGQRGHARRYLSDPAPLVRRFARKGWPGPLTLLCEEPAPEKTQIAETMPRDQLDEVFRAGVVGLRCPDHSVASRLLTEAAVPVVASSANPEGAPPPTDFDAAVRSLGPDVAYAIDGGHTRHAVASTIIAIRGNTWEIRRAGAIDERMLRRMARSLILFVCTGNSCRSPMAEYFFRRMLAECLGLTMPELDTSGYEIASAGTAAAVGGASAGALHELRGRGLDLSAHHARPLTIELVHQAERIYVMSPEHLNAVIAMAPGATGRVQLLDSRGPVPDPMGSTAEAYAQCATQIERAVAARLEEFLDEDRNW